MMASAPRDPGSRFEKEALMIARITGITQTAVRIEQTAPGAGRALRLCGSLESAASAARSI
jgi:hypothetical protein